MAIHASQFPGKVRLELLRSLREGALNHKFLYDSLKQTQKWLALHQAWAPWRVDRDCAITYERAFRDAAARIRRRSVHVIGLGCGDGRKDFRLLKLLRHSDREAFYTPTDVSVALVLMARQAARTLLAERSLFPLVCDLSSAVDLPSLVERSCPPAARLITFFGMLPNFEPKTILPRLTRLLRSQDVLLLSANLAPGADYAVGVHQILPQYDNELTREWLMTFLRDLGIETGDGQLRFRVEEAPPGSGLQRVAAYFGFTRMRQIQAGPDHLKFRRGQTIRLFFSYRHTPGLIRKLLRRHGLAVLGQWITKSGEEGVFLAGRRRKAG